MESGRGRDYLQSTPNARSPRPRGEVSSRAPRRGDHACSGDPAPEPDEDPRQDPGAVLGSDVRIAGQQVSDRLHVREGAQEGSDEAGPPLLLPDGGGEGPEG